MIRIRVRVGVTNVAVADVVIFRIKSGRHKSCLGGAINTRNRTGIQAGSDRRRLLVMVTYDRLLLDVAAAVALRTTI